MQLFERDQNNRSLMKNIEINQVFDDIKYSSLDSENSKKLIQNGYLKFLIQKNDFDGNMCYFIKPTKEVFDYMKKNGYGSVDGVQYLDIANTISFYSNWETMTTTPQIAGVLDRELLYKKLKSIIYEGDCQVNRAYTRLYEQEPNYSLNYINITGKNLEKMKILSKKLWLAVGFSLNNSEIIENANNGFYDLAFKDPEKMKFLNENFKFDKPFYIPKNRKKNSLKIK